MSAKSVIPVFLAALLLSVCPLAGITQAQNSASYKISGYILNSSGSGIEGAEIIFGVPTIVPSVHSASSGYYEIFAPAGTYHIDVWPPFNSNFIYYDQPVFVVESDTTKNITLTSGFEVSGYISDSSGAPVRNAIVSLNSYFTGYPSNSEGFYFVTAPAGTYTFSVQPRVGYPSFPSHFENNFVVNDNMAKNVTLSFLLPTPSPTRAPSPTPQVLPTPSSNPTAPQIFSDNFNDGTADGWTQQMGSWAVLNGEYRVSVGIENGISTVNGLSLADCVIQTQVRFTDSVGYRAGIVFRYLDNQHYYSFEISNEYNKIELHKYSPANPAYGEVIPPTYGSNLIAIDPNVNYQLRLEVVGSSFSAYLDGKKVLSGTDDSYSKGLVGLRARRADARFDYFLVNSDIQTPSLTTSYMSSVSDSGFNVKINGALTFNGASISGAPILLSYSVTDGASWHDLTLVHTGSDGGYSALWTLPVTGDFMLKALYQGDGNYLGTSNVVNFSIVPGTEKSVFSVISNSTLSELSFDSVSKELSFSVSGESGTIGYVNVYIPKSLMNIIPGLTVYLDSNQIEYTTQSQSDSWLLYFTYHHSTHVVMISLGSSFTPSTSSPSIQPTELPSPSPKSTPQSGFLGINLPVEYGYAIVAVLVIIVVAGLGLVYFKKLRKQKLDG